jgi:hypothetical protein
VGSPHPYHSMEEHGGIKENGNPGALLSFSFVLGAI